MKMLVSRGGVYMSVCIFVATWACQFRILAYTRYLCTRLANFMSSGNVTHMQLQWCELTMNYIIIVIKSAESQRKCTGIVVFLI